MNYDKDYTNKSQPHLLKKYFEKQGKNKQDGKNAEKKSHFKFKDSTLYLSSLPLMKSQLL